MNCYTCGRYFRPEEPHQRRRVKTGEKYRKQYKSSNVELIQATYGMRIVCKNCARYLDSLESKRELSKHASSLIVLFAIVLISVLYGVSR